jgi:L-2-hydroxyglutarate oxidase LhgO
LCWLTGAEAQALEPELACTAVLLSTATGIVDSHGLMLALLGDAERDGAVLALQSPLRRGSITPAGFVLETGGSESLRLRASMVINAAGLWAPEVAAALAGFPASRLPATHQAKGSYYALAGRSPFSHLVYPLPEIGGLGVHLTLDLAGRARFGPDRRSTASRVSSISSASNRRDSPPASRSPIRSRQNCRSAERL